MIQYKPLKRRTKPYIWYALARLRAHARKQRMAAMRVPLSDDDRAEVQAFKAEVQAFKADIDTYYELTAYAAIADGDRESAAEMLRGFVLSVGNDEAVPASILNYLASSFADFLEGEPIESALNLVTSGARGDQYEHDLIAIAYFWTLAVTGFTQARVEAVLRERYRISGKQVRRILRDDGYIGILGQHDAARLNQLLTDAYPLELPRLIAAVASADKGANTDFREAPIRKPKKPRVSAPTPKAEPFLLDRLWNKKA
jgi:hypothetical protein